MTSFTRKRTQQHKEVLGRKYRPRVVPLEKKKELEKAEEAEFKEELGRLNESDNRGTSN